MAVGWRPDKAWSDRYLPEVRAILGQVLLRPSPEEVDQRENADLVVLTLKDVKVAVRVRRARFVARYPYDVTIRSSRPSGVATELDKIIDHFATHMFYGFADGAGTLVRWVVLDLNRVRAGWIRHESFRQALCQQFNRDGSSAFCSLDMRHPYARECVVACSPGYYDDDLRAAA